MRPIWKKLSHLALAASLLAAPGLARGETAAPAASRATATSQASSTKPATPSVAKDDLDEFAQAEDESLADHRASGEEWSTGEIIVVVLLLIFLFPIGLIVLIILLIVKA